MKVENRLSQTRLSQTLTEPSPAKNISSLEQPGATESRNRNSPFEAEPAPFNFIGALPRDILYEILKKLDGPSQAALSFTDKATLELHGNILPRKYDGLTNNIFKLNPDKRHQDVFYAIHAELQRYKIIDLTPADKVTICRFFEKHVFIPKTANNSPLFLSAAQTGAGIVARHLIAGIERRFFPPASHAAAQQSLDDFTTTFSANGLVDSRKITQFLRSARKLPHPEILTSKLYRAVQHPGDAMPAKALVNFLATVGYWAGKYGAERFVSTKSPKGGLQELEILRDMLYAATPLATLLGSHSLSERCFGGRQNALILAQQEVERAIDRVKASLPTSLPGKISHFFKPHAN